MTKPDPVQGIQRTYDSRTPNNIKLEDILDSLFTRPQSSTNALLKEQLENAGLNVEDYHKRILAGEDVQPLDHYKRFPASATKLEPYKIFFSSAPFYDPDSSTSGKFGFHIEKLDKSGFSPQEIQILENYPIKFALKNSKGVMVNSTPPATFQFVKRTNNNNPFARLHFTFDIESGQVAIQDGNESYDEHTRDITLAVKSPLI